jgi:methionine aminopeptidase
VRKAGRLVAECFDMLAPEIMSGVTTEHIDRSVFEFRHRLRRSTGTSAVPQKADDFGAPRKSAEVGQLQTFGRGCVVTTN